MITISSIPAQSFTEVGQKAPLRWSVLYVETDGKAVGQHGWWKCKDFLNDSVVFLRTGKEFGIYGYKNTLKINEGLSYVALKHVPDFFEHNLQLLNAWLKHRDFPPVTVHEHDGGHGVEKVIGIPRIYWGNTFLISAITSLIRSCVFKKASTLEQCVKNEETLSGYWPQVEAAFHVTNVEKMDKLMYKNYQYTGEKVDSTPTHTIHNAGLQTWINSGAFNE